MKTTFRFFEELNDFLPVNQRKKVVPFEFHQNMTVKDAIESLGVPHTEVDLIVIDGESHPFNYILKDGDHVSVYPMFESFDIAALLKAQRPPLRELRGREIKFLVDVNLGKLAHLLLLLGFDTLYRIDLTDDEELAEISKREKRVLLTRDRGLLKRKMVDHGYFVRSLFPKDQVFEVLHRFDLFKMVHLCSRCPDCNVLLESIEKERVRELVLPEIFQSYSTFYFCPECGKIYWQGLHYRHLKERF